MKSAIFQVGSSRVEQTIATGLELVAGVVLLLSHLAAHKQVARLNCSKFEVDGTQRKALILTRLNRIVKGAGEGWSANRP